MQVNFGGFVPISTVDWRGRCTATVFFAGCPARCGYCQNAHLHDRHDYRDLEDVVALIDSARPLISAVVFSGGECTMQAEALLVLAERCQRRGLRVGIQTNGAYPHVAQALTAPRTVPGLLGALADKVSLDVKAAWARYPEVAGCDLAEDVRRSLAVYRAAHRAGVLAEFEVVLTAFRGSVSDVAAVADGLDLVLQQGRGGPGAPLTFAELCALASSLNRPVKLRTPETGEVVYQDGTFLVAGSIRVTDPKHLKGYLKGRQVSG